MKILEIRIKFTDNIDDFHLVELGEHYQRTIPVDYEAEDVRVADVTFEIKESND